MKNKSKYQMLANLLRNEIAQGYILDGARLPTENELAKKYKLSRHTVRQAISLLERDGLVIRRQGSGNYVRRLNIALKNDKGTRSIGVIFTYITEYIFPPMVRGIEEVLWDNQIALSLSSTGNRTEQERIKLEYFLHTRTNGLIIEPTKSSFPNPNLALFHAFQAQGIPIVFIHASYPELENSVYVAVDDRAGGEAAVAYLASRGHSRIGGIFKSDDIQGTERFAGYTQGLNQFKLSFKDDGVLWFDDDNKKEMLVSTKLMKVVEECSAIICYNDLIALDTIRYIESIGKRVPDDISIISFDGSVYADLTPIKLTTLAHPKRLLGQIAAQKVVNMLKGKKEKPLILGWDLIEGDSVKTLL